MKIKAFITFLFVLMLFSAVYARTIEQIKQSGYINIAIREKKTVYEKVENGFEVTSLYIEGLHYHLAELFAKRQRVKTKYRLVELSDYFEKDSNNAASLFKKVDLYADNLTSTYQREQLAAFIVIYNIIEVCVHRNDISFDSAKNLFNYTCSIASNSSYENVISAIEQQYKKKLKVIRTAKTDDQITLVLNGKADYTILDSDQAMLYIKRNKDLTINLDVLETIARIQNIGWAVSKHNTTLKDAVTEFIRSMMKSRKFQNLWKKTYDYSFEEYTQVLQLVDKRGNEYFEKALNLAYQKNYKEALDIFESAKNMKFLSKKLQDLYDFIYLKWLKEEIDASKGNNLELIDKEVIDTYIEYEPSQYVIKILKKDYRELFDLYLNKKMAQRDSVYNNGRLHETKKIQELICYLEPGSSAEKRKLERYNAEIEKVEQDKKEKELQDELERQRRMILQDQVLKTISEKEDEEGLTKRTKREKEDKEEDSPQRRKEHKEIKDKKEKEKETFSHITVEDILVKGTQEKEIIKFSDSIAEREEEHEQHTGIVGMLIDENAITTAIKLKRAPDQFTNIIIKEKIRKSLYRKSIPAALSEDTISIPKLMKKSEKEIEEYEGKRLFDAGIRYYLTKEYDFALKFLFQAKVLRYRTEECNNYINLITNIQEENLKKENEVRLEEFDLHFNRAIVNYSKEKYEEAFQDILQCLTIFPDNALAKKYWEILEDTLVLQGEISISPASPYYAYYTAQTALADRLLKEKKYTEAKNIYEEILILFPHNRDAKEKLIVCAYKIKPNELQALMKDFFTEALSLYNSGNAIDAYRKFQFIKNMNPKYPEIDEYLKKSKPIIKKQAKKEADDTFNSKRLVKQAISLYQDGKKKEALIVLQRVLEHEPENYKALISASKIENELRLTITHQGRQLKKQHNEKAENYYLKGQFYYRLKDYNKAIQYWEKTYKADPSYTKALLNIKKVKKLLSRRVYSR
ncbi:transporter substrate-binding domain-containing protein [Spirochaetota bacterium]